MQNCAKVRKGCAKVQRVKFVIYNGNAHISNTQVSVKNRMIFVTYFPYHFIYFFRSVY